MSEGKTTDEKLAVVAKAVLEVAAMAAIKPERDVYQSVGVYLEPDLKKALAEIAEDEVKHRFQGHGALING